MNLLKISAYFSIAIVAILVMLVTESWMSAIPFVVNTVLIYLYFKGDFKNKELAVVFSALMLVVNITIAMTDQLSLLDVGFWAVNIYAWSKSE